MVMEKYSLDRETLLLDLQNEEARIMQQISQKVSFPLTDQQEITSLESRRAAVREKIEELRSEKQPS